MQRLPLPPVYKKIKHTDEVETLLQKKFDLSELSRQEISGDREVLLKDKAENSYTLYINSEGNWLLTDDLYTPVQPSLAVQETLVKKAKSMMDELSLLPKDGGVYSFG